MTFPSINTTLEGYSLSCEPQVARVVYASKNTRQRKYFQKRNDMVNVRHMLSDAEFTAFESYVYTDLNGGADTDTMPYYVGNYQTSGTAQIVEGSYSANLLRPDLWEVTYTMELINRDLTDEENAYNMINALGGFDDTNEWLQALEDMVNNNTLS